MATLDLNKLMNDIAYAAAVAIMYDEVEDGGSCNFDTPMVELKLTKKEREAVAEFLTPVGERGYKNWYFVEVSLCGQGNRRTKMAEAAAQTLAEAGYNASVYYQLD
jgi:hypothetical protein